MVDFSIAQILWNLLLAARWTVALSLIAFAGGGVVGLALTEGQVFLRVVLPPALGRVWPAMTSQIVIVMLGSAVCGQIAAQELSYAANLIQSRTFRAFESFIVVTAMYLALSVFVRQALNWLGPRWIFGHVPGRGR